MQPINDFGQGMAEGRFYEARLCARSPWRPALFLDGRLHLVGGDGGDFAPESGELFLVGEEIGTVPQVANELRHLLRTGNTREEGERIEELRGMLMHARDLGLDPGPAIDGNSRLENLHTAVLMVVPILLASWAGFAFESVKAGLFVMTGAALACMVAFPHARLSSIVSRR